MRRWLAATGIIFIGGQGAFAACDAPAFRQFDFWLGRWTVTQVGQPDRPLGQNKISAIDGGCAILEQWTSRRGSTGTSLNLYDPVDDRWRQIWVSDQGYQLEIAGGWSEGAMRLEGEIIYYDGRRYPFRGAWMAGEDGSVRQIFHEKRDGEWQLWFEGHYEKIEK